MKGLEAAAGVDPIILVESGVSVAVEDGGVRVVLARLLEGDIGSEVSWEAESVRGRGGDEDGNCA